MKLLLLSSSRVADTEYLEHANSYIKTHLGTTIRSVLFIPYAGVSIGFDSYADKVEQVFSQLGYQLSSVHTYADPISAVNEAEAIVVGGGNTFCLLNSLYQNNILEAMRTRIASGVPYIGWSAGSNIAGETIKTTNDMPIIQPPSFDALSLLPFQLNPHYIDGNPPGHQGETREQRIEEFLMVNPDKKVVGIPEGTALRLENEKLTYCGEKEGFLFSRENGKQIVQPDQDLSFLLSHC